MEISSRIQTLNNGEHGKGARAAHDHNGEWSEDRERMQQQQQQQQNSVANQLELTETAPTSNNANKNAIEKTFKTALRVHFARIVCYQRKSSRVRERAPNL